MWEETAYSSRRTRGGGGCVKNKLGLPDSALTTNSLPSSEPQMGLELPQSLLSPPLLSGCPKGTHHSAYGAPNRGSINVCLLNESMNEGVKKEMLKFQIFMVNSYSSANALVMNMTPCHPSFRLYSQRDRRHLGSTQPVLLSVK